MSTAETGVTADQEARKGVELESPWRTVAAAFGWLALAMFAPLLVDLFSVFVTKTTVGSDEATWPITAKVLYKDARDIAVFSIFLLAAHLHKHMLSRSRIRPVNNAILAVTIIGALILATVGYVVLLLSYVDPTHTSITSDVWLVEGWPRGLTFLIMVVLAPVAEELFFRGWLWAALTSSLWLALHLGYGLWQPMVLIPAAIILSLARYIGGSPATSIPLHMIHNLVVALWPILGIPEAGVQFRTADASCVKSVQEQDYARAIEDCSTAINLNPKSAAAYVNRAAALVARREFERAIADATKAIALDPKSAMAWNNRAAANAASAKLDDAIADATNAIKINPKLASAFRIRGAALLRNGELDKAIDDASKAIEIDPKFADAYDDRATALIFEKDYDRAIEDATSAVQIDPNLGAALVHRAIANVKRRRADEAIADANSAIAINPQNASAYAARSEAQLIKRNFDQAIADATKAIETDGRSEQTYFVRALALNAKGDRESAVADFSEIIKLDPTIAGTYFYRGKIYEDRGDLDLAIDDFNEALRLDPTLLGTYWYRGQAHFFKGEFAAAADDFQPAHFRSGYAYALLWRSLAIAHLAQNGQAELAAGAAQLKSKNWPYPVLEFYSGSRSAEEMRSTAGQPNEKCEADFYEGEWDLVHDRSETAKVLLRAAVDNCPKAFIEYRGAISELKRLEK
jgi:tetratricopeptide (TPR) repeat protein/membrane protease YdiL (CAAX protease family)